MRNRPDTLTAMIIGRKTRSGEIIKVVMSEPEMAEDSQERVACEAAYLLNESIRQLQAPVLVIEWMKRVGPGFVSGGAVRNILISSTILHLRRLKETRDHFLVPWLFTEEELEKLKFPSLEQFVGGKAKRRAVEMLRHQFAGHATRHKPAKDIPGRLIGGYEFGRGLRDTGVAELESFLKRIQEDLLDGVVNVRDELNRRFPRVEKFIKNDYPLEIERGRLGR